MHLTCSKCNHTIDLKPEFLNPDGSYYGRCSNCGFRLIKQPERVEEQTLKPVNKPTIFTHSKVPRKYTLEEIANALFIQSLVASFFALILAWNNSKNPIEFGHAIIIYMLWVASVGIGAMKTVQWFRIRHHVLAGVLSVCGAIFGYLLHWFMLYIFSGGLSGNLLGFISNRLDQGVVIETVARFGGSYLTDVGRTALLITWAIEPILYFFMAYLGGTRQANNIPYFFNEKTNSWE